MTNTAIKQTNETAETIAPPADQIKRTARQTTTKKAQLIRLLERKGGADASTISATFGWQPHTTRAALSGLRKAGYGITAEKPKGDKPARYRIKIQPGGEAGK